MRARLSPRRASHQETSRRRQTRPRLECVERRIVLSTLLVETVADDGPGSLRWALNLANADLTSAPTRIEFQIPGNGLQTIQLESPLPQILRPVQIEGRSQPGYTGAPLIQITGPDAGLGPAHGLILSGGNSLVAGLALTGFRGAGVLVTGPGGDVVESNYVGLLPGDDFALSNGEGIVVLGASGVTIGGEGIRGNVVAGNRGAGIRVQADQEARGSGVAIVGNRIGTDGTGNLDVGNGGEGILLAGAAQGWIIGNLISANHGAGVSLVHGATGNLLIGNIVGLAADGVSLLGNRQDGVLVDDAPANTIGGNGPGEGNVIAGNRGSGIHARRNAVGLVIQGNSIGTDSTGDLSLGNLGNGVTLASSGVQVGGSSSGAGNVIAYNGTGRTGAGVQLVGLVDRNTILSNRIFSNLGLGINLSNGPTPNHPPGELAGPNDWINYPVLDAASSDGLLTTIKGRFSGTPSSDYLIQFFWSRSIDRTGFGEGERLLGQLKVSTDEQGFVQFDPPITSAIAGGFLSATATDSSGNTSEFARSILIQPETDLSVTATSSPSRAPMGSTATYSFLVTNNGQLVAHGVEVDLSIPLSANVKSAIVDRGVISPRSASKLTALVGELAPGESATINLILQPSGLFSGELLVSASATMTTKESRPGDESAAAIVRLTPVVAISLTGSSVPAAVRRDEDFAYILTATNAGPATATNVVLTLPMDPGIAYLGATGTQGSGRHTGDFLIVDLGSLAPGASASVTVNLRGEEVGIVTTTATLSAFEFDANPGDQSATLVTTILGRTDLSAVIQIPRVAALGRDLVYSVVVANAGPDAARDITALNLIPEGASFLAASFEGGEAHFANGVVTARRNELKSGESATLWVIVRPPEAAGSGAMLTSSARVLAGSDDLDLDNNADWRETELRPSGDLATTITPSSSIVLQGRPTTFHVRVANLGESTDPDARLMIPIPAGATFLSGSSSQGAPPIVESDAIVFRLGSIPVGTSIDLEFVLQPEASFTGPLAATAIIQGWNLDDAPENNQATASTMILATVDLATYVSPPLAVYERTSFQYTLTAANRSATAANGVLLTADLPEGVEFVSAVSSQGEPPVLDSGRIIAAIGDLDGGETAELTITVRPLVSAGVLLLLKGSTTSTSPQTPDGDDVGRFAVQVAPAVDLMIRTRPIRDAVDLGGDMLWFVDVWNSSPTWATDVVLTIPFQACGDFVGASTTQGTFQAADGRLLASLGSLAPGAYATIAFVLRSQTVGLSSLTATAEARQFNVRGVEAEASAVVSVIEPPGTIQFASSSITVLETDGYASIVVDRVGGARGPVTVDFWTTGGDAAPGVDYHPVAGVLTFQPGQTRAVVNVPVLPYAHNQGDRFVGIVLANPSGGATLGAAVGSLRIQDVDPDLTPPTISRVRLLGDPHSIAGLAVEFSESVRFDTATNGAAYTLYDLGPAGIFGDGDDVPIAYTAPGYDPASRTVYLTPTAPMALGRHYALIVRGAGDSAVIDLAGHRLGGGVDYVGLFARGASLTYTDSTGDVVALQTTGGGWIDLMRSSAGDARLLSLRGAVAGRSTLSGSVTRPRGGGGDGVTTIDAIEGLGAFGDVRVTLKSPPFLARDVPFTPGRSGPGRPVQPPRTALPSPVRIVPPLRRLPGTR